MIRSLRHAFAFAALVTFGGLGACGGGGGHGGTGGPTPMFTSAANLTLLAGVSAVAMADFNLDGTLDLAVTNAATDAVEVSLGTGTGAYGPPSLLPLAGGASPAAILAADFNTDGMLDLATANSGTENVAILFGLGGGVFGPPIAVPLAIGTAPSGLVAADFDGDGDLDLATSDQGLHTFSVALGDGLGGFTVGPASSVAPGFSPSSIAQADFNRDGLEDLVVASSLNGSVAVMTGAGLGAFNAPSLLPVGLPGANMAAVATADLNRDGNADIVVTNRTSGQVFVLLGNGNATFGVPSPFATGADATALGTGDFDRDGRLDLAVTLAASGQVAVVRGNGDGTLAAAVLFAAGGTGSTALAIGDADIDGSLDLAVANGTTGDVGVLLGADRTLTVSFSVGTSVLIGLANQPAAVVTADVNGDGRLDLLTANTVGNNVSVALGTGTGTFGVATPFALAPGDGPTAIAAADFNGDSNLDIAATAGGTHLVRILLGTGTGAFNPPSFLTLPALAGPSAVVAADFNTDGSIDLAVANKTDATVYFFPGNGNGTFGLAVPLAALLTPGFAPTAMVVGDWDHDGGLDLALSSDASGTVEIYLGNGAGAFALGTPVLVSAGTDLKGIAAADFDHDGNLDLAVTNFTNSNISVLPGDGAGLFGLPVSLAVGAGASGITFGDFDCDGDLDLALTLVPTGQIRILLGNGDATFGAVATLATGGVTVTSIATGDFNRDGKSDFAVAYPGGGTVEIQLGS